MNQRLDFFGPTADLSGVGRDGGTGFAFGLFGRSEGGAGSGLMEMAPKRSDMIDQSSDFRVQKGIHEKNNIPQPNIFDFQLSTFM
ncbi:MAG: hypothetical protein NTY00_11645 [Deltaproteobacteria bacterium]|nr:hypothetical protein [Deltaproteobacteria bacterium]